MWRGILFGLAAGLLWGMVFVGPLLVPEYPPVLLSCGRYLAFGLITLPLGWMDREGLRDLSRADWVEAFKLAAVGNLLYYLMLASAIQYAGGPLPTMIIGTLPVVISLCAKLGGSADDKRVAWRALLPSLGVILLGILCVHHAEWTVQAEPDGGPRLLGVGCALVALGCWTWYPIRNARWLRAHGGRQARCWASAQGLATLPLAVLGYLACWVWFARGEVATFPMPLGPRPVVFVSLMLAIGLLASWLGTLCWNEASKRVSTTLLGQLIVFETLSALAYAFVLRGQWPGLATSCGIVLLVAGVVMAGRASAQGA